MAIEKKKFADLAALRYFKQKLETIFAKISHNQASNTIDKMTGYSKPLSTSAISSSDSLNTAIGKLEKALDTVTPGEHTHESDDVTAMTGYSKPESSTAVSAISTSDTLNTAIGKLERALDDKQIKGDYLAADGTAVNSEKLGGTEAASYAKLDSPTFTGTPNSTTAAAGTNTTQIATTAFVQTAVSGKSDSNHRHDNATTTTDGFMSSTDKTKLDGIAENANNYSLPEATSSVLGGVKIGSNITNSSGTISLTKSNVTTALGYTPPTSDTTYSDATQSDAGLMSAADKTKLDGIAENANNYSLPTASSTTLGGVKVGTNLSISNGVLSATDTTYSDATQSDAGLMSAEDKTKLDGIADGAQVNTITGIKGNSESSYRNGDVNLTAANIGALAADGTAVNSEKLGGTEAASYAKLDSPTFTGTPKSTTAAAGTNTTQIATTAFVQTAVNGKSDNGHKHVTADITDFPTIPVITDTYSGTSSNGMSGKAVKSAIDAALTSAYKPSGSVAYASLPTLSASVMGNVYNVSDSFTIDDRFVEYSSDSTKTYPAGTEVGVVNTGTASSPTYKFSVFSGFIDLSEYQQTSTAVTHTASTAVGSTKKPVYINASGVATEINYTIEKSVPSDAVFTDTNTKNTAGSTNTSSKIFLVGATSQAANPQTYSHDTAFVDANGRVNSAAPASNANDTTVATTKWVKDQSYITGVAWEDVTGKPSTFTPPTASSTTLGGVKVGTNLSISNGVLSATDEKVTATKIAFPSGPHYYYLTASNTTSTATEGLSKFGMDAHITVSAGTTSNDGVMELSLGNNIASGTDGNTTGSIALFNNKGYNHIIRPHNGDTVARAIYTPKAGGTLVVHTTDTKIGNTNKPVYISADGVATAISYTIDKSVPSDAVFTDTTYSAATQSAAGLMSATDKTKLDGLDDSDYVKLDGTQTITGNKTFTRNFSMQQAYSNIEKGTIPSANKYPLWFSVFDSSGTDEKNRLSSIGTRIDTDGNVITSLYSYKNEANSTTLAPLSIVFPKTGNPYATAPTPSDEDSSSKVATTEWVTNNIGNNIGGLSSSTLIETNTDLDTLNTPGFYYSNGSTRSETLINTPITNSAFRLIVYNTGTGNYRKQIAFNYQKTCERYFNSGTNKWGDWRQLAYTDSDITGNAATASELSYVEGTVNSARHVWFSNTSSIGKLVYNDKFKYNPSTDILTVGSITGNAATASKINTSAKIGDSNKPVYVAADGTVTAISYTIDKSVPSDAVFTDTNTKVTSTATNPSTSKWYPICSTSSSTETNTTVKNSNIYFDILTGTANQEGFSTLYLGNSTASGTAGNQTGGIMLYNDKGKYINLVSSNGNTSNCNVYFPKGEGTLVIGTHDAKTGDTNNPVYINANGKATAISYTIDKSVPSNAVFTDTKVTQTITTPTTSGSKYHLVTAPNSTESTATEGLNKFGCSYLYIKNGTTSVEGQADLALGNSTASGTAGNVSGGLTLYNNKGIYHYISPHKDDTTNRTIYTPKSGGTLVCHTTDTAIGSSSQPVYISASGVATACKNMDSQYPILTQTDLNRLYSDSDLNDITTPGTYWWSTESTNGKPSNTPCNYGKMFVINTLSTRWVTQLVFSHDSKIFIRKGDHQSSGDTWDSWLSLSKSDHTHSNYASSSHDHDSRYFSLVGGTGTKIEDNTDLNTLKTPGTYYCPSSTNAATYTNCPYTGANFKLIVRMDGSNNYGSQMLLAQAAIWIRGYTPTTWAGWKRIATTDADITGNAATATKATQDGDGNTISSTYVKIAGTQDITGVKTFTNTVNHRTGATIDKGTTPTSTKYPLWNSILESGTGTAAKNRFSAIHTTIDTSGNVSAGFYAYKNVADSTASTSLNIVYPKTGDPYATCPTPDDSANDNKIATTAWVTTKLGGYSTTSHTHSNYYNLSHDNTTIASGTDLNTLTTPGMYRSSSSSITNSLTNCPITGVGFKLSVERTGYNEDYIMQKLVHFNNIYIRGKGSSSSSWGDWRMISTANDKVTNTLGTTTKFYVTGTTSSTTTTGAQYFDTGIYSTTTAGRLHVTSLELNSGIILS